MPVFLGYLVWGACFPRIFGMGCFFLGYQLVAMGCFFPRVFLVWGACFPRIFGIWGVFS